MCPLCRVWSEVFVISIIDSPYWEDQCEWHRMTRMTGPDCAVMCNLINAHTHTHTWTGTRVGSRRAEERRRSARNHTRLVGAGGDLGGKREKSWKDRVGPVAANPDNLENDKEARGEHKVPGAYVRIVQVERVCPLCCVWSEVFIISIIDPPLGGSMRVV